MVAARHAYSKGRTLARGVSAVFAIFFGLFALFFASVPKLWGTDSSHRGLSPDFFSTNTVRADVPGDPGGGYGGDCGDSGCDAGGGGDSCG